MQKKCKNQNVARIIKNLRNDKCCTREALASICEYLAAGVGGYSRYNCSRALVEYICSCAIRSNSCIAPEADIMHHFFMQFKSVKNAVADNTDNNSAKAKKAEEIYYFVVEQPQNLRLETVYRFLICNWNLLSNMSVTYRLMRDMVIMQSDWSDAVCDTRDLADIIAEVAVDWSDEGSARLR